MVDSRLEVLAHFIRELPHRVLRKSDRRIFLRQRLISILNVVVLLADVLLGLGNALR